MPGPRNGSDKNPVVKVQAIGADTYQAVCFTDGLVDGKPHRCQWSRRGPVKVGMQEEARHHREWHRRLAVKQAVPNFEEE